MDQQEPPAVVTENAQKNFKYVSRKPETLNQCVCVQ